MSYNFTAIDKKWQRYWLENQSFRALDPKEAGAMPKAYILDMFPYPSGAGLHVGHPEGYTATDIVARYLRMRGYNVLHPMGWDAFGLPAEQYAISKGIHPRVTTEQNIANFRRQIQMLGLSYDWQREIDTTDPDYYRWTQWIFLQLFESYFDPFDQKAKPISHLMNELENGNFLVAPDGSIHLKPEQESLEAITGELRIERQWQELAPEEQADVIDGLRLAYMDEVPVNWCPALGTVLANEEVIDGKSDVGGYPVVKQPMRQWMLRITAYADRLVDDLKLLDWPESLKEMQRNWIGKSVGAEVDFEIDPPSVPVKPVPEEGEEDLVITVFTTRPDTLYGATYMVLSPEHPLVDRIASPQRREEIDLYRQTVAAKSERDRMADAKEKTGVFTGASAINPLNNQKIPIWIADYVLMGYGTGAIMAVPAHDERDFEFAKKFHLPIKAVVRPSEEWLSAHRSTGKSAASTGDALQTSDHAFTGEGIAMNSGPLDGLTTSEAKQRAIDMLESDGAGRRSINYKLRDWLFSRQRYWGEPFPIVLDAMDRAHPIPDNELPLVLPEMKDFKPTGTPEPPLSKAKAWINTTLKGKPAVRETNTMPQWAGSCWYYLRYIDPKNSRRFVDPEKERYWMPVDLYVGGVEHAVLHLLYARFWHKVLFDLGHVSTPEPFKRLVNQGAILGEMEFHLFAGAAAAPISASEVEQIAEEASADGRRLVGIHKPTHQRVVANAVDPDLVEKRGDRYVLKSQPDIALEARSFKMSKSRGNVVNPDQIVGDYGADTFRLYEMYMGPLEAQKPWNTRDIVGMSRFLSSVFRNLVGDEENGKIAAITSAKTPDALDRQLHRTIKKVGEDIDTLRFNTAIAELIKLNNEMSRLSEIPKSLAEDFTLLLAPFAPHLAEEIWSRLGHGESLARHAWPTFDPHKLVELSIELPVQVNGKLRGTVSVPAAAGKDEILKCAKEVESVKPWVAGKELVKQVYVERKMVSFVVK